MQLLFLNEHCVRQLLDPVALLAALAEGFMAISEKTAVAPDRSEVKNPDAGVLLTMSAWKPASPFVVKMVSFFPGNSVQNLPACPALICLFDEANGLPLAVMDGAYLTAIRTAAAAALSAQLLTRPNVRRIAIVGAGVQGAAHIECFSRIFELDEIRIVSRHIEHAEQLAQNHPNARVSQSGEDAVREADIVCLCTASAVPVIEADWIVPGTHISSVGYSDTGGELPTALLKTAKLFVETRQAFELPPVGCSELQGLNPQVATELGEVLLKRRPGRQTDSDITVYKSMGHAVEDMVAAHLAYSQAIKSGLGQRLEL